MLIDKTRVFLIDDHQLLVESLSAMYSANNSIEVVGFAFNSDASIDEVLLAMPDVVLLDIELPGRGAFDFAAELNVKAPHVHILFLSGHFANIFLSQVLSLKAGYFLKSESLTRLTVAIEQTQRGDPYYSPEVSQLIVRDTATGRLNCRIESDISGLSPRQLDVLRHLARGQSVKEIAKKMHTTLKSIDSHKYRIMNRLGIHDRVELARFAIREGLLVP